MSSSTAPRAVLLDIEGTTTSISFVYDTLFPFARREIPAYLEAHWADSDLQAAITHVRSLAAEETAGDAPGAVSVLPADHPEPAAVRRSVVASLLWQMDADRKTTGLKAVQGLVWRDGYHRGELRGHVYPDVPLALFGWSAAGAPVYIYSSGSVAAQELLFSCSAAGDLTVHLSGYFDTTTGSKKDPDSYRAIARTIGLPPHAVTFATDSLGEAEAAAAAGVTVAVSVRPGNPELPPHGFPVITSLEQLDAVAAAALPGDDA